MIHGSSARASSSDQLVAGLPPPPAGLHRRRVSQVTFELSADKGETWPFRVDLALQRTTEICRRPYEVRGADLFISRGSPPPDNPGNLRLHTVDAMGLPVIIGQPFAFIDRTKSRVWAVYRWVSVTVPPRWQPVGPRFSRFAEAQSYVLRQLLPAAAPM